MIAAIREAISRRRNRTKLDRLLKAQTAARHAALIAATINDPIQLGVAAHYVSRHASQMLHFSEQLANDAASKAAFRLLGSSSPIPPGSTATTQKDTSCHSQT